MQLKVVGLRFKSLLTMKLLILFTVVACLQVSARGYSQAITLSLENAPLEKAFKEIKKQTGYAFVYTRAQLKNTVPVTYQVRNGQLKDVLEECFRNQPLSFVIEGRYIVVQTKTAVTEKMIQHASTIDITGRVVNENGEPLAGVTIVAKNSNKATSTNERGEFSLREINDDDVLIITSIGYYREEIPIKSQSNISVSLKIAVGSLDETIVMAYGKTTRRLNTGNITQITSEEIGRQPVSNPLATLEGRVPGMIVTQTSGVPGSSFHVEIRGRSSLDQKLSRNDPLIVIDGVPFEAGNLPSNQIASAANKPTATQLGGLSPLNTLNPADIESIEILKDADATAIYGSRGANGVILITTKRGVPGKTNIYANVSAGFSKANRTMDMLNTEQYLSMRNEAFRNDNRTMSSFNAPDLILWDTTRYTDFKKLLIGKSAHFSDAQLSYSGGSSNTQFLIGAGYHAETNVFSDDLSDKRISFHTSLSHSSKDKRFNISFSSFYANDKNQLIQSDLTQFINLPPNFLLYDSLGRPNWSEGGFSISTFPFSFATTPAAELEKKYTSVNENLSANVSSNYRIISELTLKINLGYNRFLSDEVAITPKLALDPASMQLAFSNFSNGSSKNWIIEPHIEYVKHLGNGKLSVLMGSSWQERTTKSNFTSGTNYASDLLLNSIGAAGNINATNNHSKYRYTALFGRLNYNWKEKYIVNLSARRDGSSRFGPGKQFANFGAAGAAWIFSSEPFIQKSLKFLSFGKIRASYGVTGNDQIGNYRFLDLWNSTILPYQEMSALEPISLFNPGYEWEINKKSEVGLELGFIKDRILFTVSYYRNRSSNQLISYLLPDQTGFTTITKNLPALVQNSGLEITFSSKNVQSKTFKWVTNFTITVPKNELVSFPGLAGSSYANLYKEGEPLSVYSGYRYTGVDPASGIYTFEDIDKDGQITFPNDYSFLGDTDPKIFGGLQNSFRYKNFELSCFFDYRKQVGKNYLAIIGGNHPGLPINQPLVALRRWQDSGDIAEIQKYTSRLGGLTGIAASNLSQSDGIISDASFIRLKNVSISYSLPQSWLKSLSVASTSIYLQAQNLAIITNYKGSDPETQDIYVLPPLKTFVAGIKLNF